MGCCFKKKGRAKVLKVQFLKENYCFRDKNTLDLNVASFNISLYVLLVLRESRSSTQEVKMNISGNDSHFQLYSPYAQVNAVDFKVVCLLAFFIYIRAEREVYYLKLEVDRSLCLHLQIKSLVFRSGEKSQ